MAYLLLLGWYLILAGAVVVWWSRDAMISGLSRWWVAAGCVGFAVVAVLAARGHR